MTWYVFCSHSSTLVHVRKLTTVPHEGRMKERKREKEGHDMNRHLGERERAKLLFLLTCVLLDTRKN